MEIADLYRQMRLAVSYRETFGRLPNVDHLPAWHRENLDELGLTAVRLELIETFKTSGLPRPEWELDDREAPPGDWVNISEHPEALVEHIDSTVHDELNQLAVGIVRDFLNNRSTNRSD